MPESTGRPGSSVTRAAAVFALAVILGTVTVQAQLGQWTYYANFENTRYGAAVYPGRGRINLLVTCPQPTLAAVSITVDNGVFDAGTILAEWDQNGEAEFHEASVLAGGRSLGFPSAAFIRNLRARNSLPDRRLHTTECDTRIGDDQSGRLV